MAKKVIIKYSGSTVEKASIKEGAKYLIEELINKKGINNITEFNETFKDIKITNLAISPEEYEKIEKNVKRAS